MSAWEDLHAALACCRDCPLGQTRNRCVLGEGCVNTKLMFIGEGPGAQEDAMGRPFVGAAGQLLDRMLGALALPREQVYIANIVKCRPPGNRAPTPDEAQTCLKYLRAQAALIRPKVIVCLGATALRYVMDENARISQIRGQWVLRKGVWMMATYHPAALLRDETKKRPAWADMQAVRDKLKELGVWPGEGDWL